MKPCCALEVLKERKECEMAAREWARSYMKLAKNANYSVLADVNQKKSACAQVVADEIKFRELPRIDQDTEAQYYEDMVKQIDVLINQLSER